MVLKIDCNTVKLQIVTYHVTKIMSLKIHHQNDVIKFSIFKLLP